MVYQRLEFIKIGYTKVSGDVFCVRAQALKIILKICVYKVLISIAEVFWTVGYFKILFFTGLIIAFGVPVLLTGLTTSAGVCIYLLR